LALLPILLVKVHKDDVAVDYNLNGMLVALQKLSLANKLYLPLVSKTTM
jgi:hypothetical protein